MEIPPLSDKPLQVNPDQAQSQPDPEEATRQQNIYVDGLKAAIGSSGGALENAINEFLSGKGELHDTAAAALSRKGGSAVSDVESVLEKQFDLNPAIARLVASLMVKLVPSLKEAKQAKPRRKPKTTASAKKEAAAKKKAKKKTAAKKKTTTPASKKKTSAKAKPKRKAAGEKPAAKKKTAAKKTPKKAATKKKAKKAI